jgi:hypothetical protein
MTDIETIKSRVRKLMAVAGDGVASANEIESAMRLAAKLLDAHHLTPDECATAGPGITPEPHRDTKPGQSWSTSQATRFSNWENKLARAVAALFGGVNYYRTHDVEPIRENGVAKLDARGELRRGVRVCFYGPRTDAIEAADLFTEWSRAIATMGVARWGGCFKGDGARYCDGFAAALDEQAEAISGERRKIAAPPAAVALLAGPTGPRRELAALAGTAVTLYDHYRDLRHAGKRYVEKANGVKLRVTSRSGYGEKNADPAARAEGYAHGKAAGFGRAAPAAKRLT